MKKALIIPAKAIFVLFAFAEIAQAQTPEEFCLDLTVPAAYYFEAKAHGGVPNELLNRWLIRAATQFDFDFSGNSTAIIRELGVQVQMGELTKLEALDELFIPCVNKYRVQWN